MHLLVTGGAGFIGHHTVRRLVGDGHAVRVLDDLSTGRRERLDGLDVDWHLGSITDPATVASAMEGVTHVLHLAARVSVPESFADPLAYDAVNVRGFLHVALACAASGARLVYASSCAVYGSRPGLPKSEDDPLQPESPYAATKLANEAYAAALAPRGLDSVGLRYFNVFGPGQDPEGPYGAVLPKFVSRALAGAPLGIHGDGQQGRDFVAVEDVARANVAALAADTPGALVCNVGTGRMLSIGQLADVVEAEVAAVGRTHGPAREGDVRFSRADVSRARRALGWEATADFGEALAATVRAFGRAPTGR